jgi:hypothetical protein
VAILLLVAIALAARGAVRTARVERA